MTQARGRLAALSALAVALTVLALLVGGWALLSATTGSVPAPARTQEPSPTPTGPQGTPSAPVASSPFAVEEVSVIRVVDGDTIHVRMPDSADETIRFIGVNTPESTTRHEPYGNEASAYTKVGAARQVTDSPRPRREGARRRQSVVLGTTGTAVTGLGARWNTCSQSTFAVLAM